METLSKAKQVLLSAASFPALISFQIWATADRAPEGQIIAATSMLAYCVLVIVISYRWDKPGYFDWAIAGYFTVITIALLLWPEGASQYLRHYAVTGIYVCLFSAAFFPPLLGMDPFTYHYAKKSAPPGVWNNPIFIKINRIMTFVWSGIFALGIVLSLYPSIIMRAIIPNVLILCFGLPFSSRFPDYYLRRLGLPSRAEQERMAQKNPDRMALGPSAFPLPATAQEATEVINQPFITGKENTMKVLALNSSPEAKARAKPDSCSIILSRE